MSTAGLHTPSAAALRLQTRRAEDECRGGREWVGATGACAGAVVLALLISRIHAMFAGRAETAVQAAVVLVVAVVAGAALAAWLTASRAEGRVGRVALAMTCATVTSLVAIYLFWVSDYVRYPGDFLIWSESDYVNDILKFNKGYPLFTEQANNESFTYMPGSQLLTMGLAGLAGQSSIAAWRAVQILYLFLAAVLGVASCRSILTLAGRRVPVSGWWTGTLLMLLFLIGTNSLTSPFAHALHNDSLAVLLTSAAFWLMARYAATRSAAVLAAMALLPALGFYVKQNFVIWYALFGLYLVLFDRPWSLRRIAAYGAGGAAALVGAFGTAMVLWGEPFRYWAVYVLGQHGVSPLRSLQHVMDAWVFFAILLVSPLALMRGKLLTTPLAGAWLITAALLALGAYTSGIAWMLNHMAPGSLLVGVWFAAALASLAETVRRWRGFEGAVQAAVAVACLLLILAGLRTVRIPLGSLSADAWRYAEEIERQLAAAPEATLLDVGSWQYLPRGVVMKDRAPCIGERGVSQTGDFSGIRGRIRDRKYARILVRSFHKPDFWYDSALWAKSSGIRQTLEENYRETAVIREAAGSLNRRDAVHDPYLFGDISILEPKPRP